MNLPFGDGDARLARTVDHLLGETTDEERAAFREFVAWDVDLATEVAETRHLFERMRGLDVEPTDRVERVLHRAVQRRLALRGATEPTWQERASIAVRVAAVAMITLGVCWALFGSHGLLRRGLSAGEWFDRDGVPSVMARVEMPQRSRPRAPRREIDEELRRLLDPNRTPVATAEFKAQLALLSARPVPDDFVGLLSAENLLAHLRAESELRFSASARQRARRVNGTPDLDDRIATLAAEVAVRTDAALTRRSDAVSIDELAFALRALLAAGSSTDQGPHATTVAACRSVLLAELGDLGGRDLGGGERATALAALAELAVFGDAEIASVVAVGAEDLARETLRGAAIDRPRPDLLNWLTPAHRLADAGRLLLVAPAFGTHAGLAFRARLTVAAHFGERLERWADAEKPDLVAAQLYGFGDLIDRREADRRLALWPSRALRSDPIALHHLGWSKYPVRPGWAEFQRELRGIAGMATPADLTGASALLLALCTNVAAPGIREGLGDGAL